MDKLQIHTLINSGKPYKIKDAVTKEVNSKYTKSQDPLNKQREYIFSFLFLFF